MVVIPVVASCLRNWTAKWLESQNIHTQISLRTMGFFNSMARRITGHFCLYLGCCLWMINKPVFTYAYHIK